MTNITIYHNPACGTSRNVLALIRNSGVEPTVIEYLKNPPSTEQILSWLIAIGLTVRQVLREKGTPYAELDLANAKWTDEELLDFIQQYPILLNRPFVITPLGVRLCRPSEMVLDILPDPQQGSFIKEDGEVVIDAEGAVSKSVSNPLADLPQVQAEHFRAPDPAQLLRPHVDGGRKMYQCGRRDVPGEVADQRVTGLEAAGSCTVFISRLWSALRCDAPILGNLAH